MANDALIPSGEILVYQTEDGRTRVECRFAEETIWLSQALIAQLFQVSVPTVNEHLRHIYAEREIDEEATIRSFRIVRREGTREVSRDVEHYNLDAILAASGGCTSASARSSPSPATTIRGVRRPSSSSGPSRTVSTSPRPDMESNVVRKGDVTVAKNYLGREEISELNRIVTMWLDFAEDQARRRKQVFLNDWEAKLNEFLRFNERAVLGGKGTISKTEADARAEAEYETFAARRRELLEAEGERATLAALEKAAKELPARPKGKRPKR